MLFNDGYVSGSGTAEESTCINEEWFSGNIK